MRGKMVLRRVVINNCLAVLCLLVFLTNPSMADNRNKAKKDSTFGELKLNGKYIKKLVLFGGKEGRRVFVEPVNSIKLPVGDYQIQEILMQSGEADKVEPRYTGRKITIDANKLTELNMGGPLKQIIKVEKLGSVLVLNYELLGIGGEKYTLRGQKEPQFDIYKGDKKIASGTFRYG